MKVKEILTRVAKRLELDEEVKLLDICGINHNVDNLMRLLNLGARDLVGAHGVKIVKTANMHTSQQNGKLPLACLGDDWIRVVSVTQSGEFTNYEIDEEYIKFQAAGMHEVTSEYFPMWYYLDDELEPELEVYATALEYFVLAFATAQSGPFGINYPDANEGAKDFYMMYLAETARLA